MLLPFVLAGCSPRIVEHVRTEYRDTTIYQRARYDSLVFVDLPLEKNQVIVEIGDTSKLETSVAKSTAFVNALGLLCHTLENKCDKLPILVPVTHTFTHTGATTSSVHDLSRIVYQDKPLTWWQDFRIKSFWWLLGGLALALLWIFRRPILKMLKI